MSSPETPPIIASGLITACTTHIRELSKLSGKSIKNDYRTPLCHEFGRFRLWTRAFDNTPPADGNILEEVLEDAIYLKEPIVLLLASFASCLLDDCLRKVGNDYTRTLLRLSLSEVAKAYPQLDSKLKREWKTQDAAIGELRECIDALFDVLSTLDKVMEEMKEDETTGVSHMERPITRTNAPQPSEHTTSPETSPFGKGQEIPEGLGFEYPLTMVGGGALAEGESAAMTGSLERQASSDRWCSSSISGDMEDQEALEKAFWEEKPAPPSDVMGKHWEIYQQYIRDRFPHAIEQLDIEGFSKGNVDCYDRLVRLDEDRGKEREEKKEEQKEELKEEKLVFENVGQSAHLPPVLEESEMHIQTAQDMLEGMKDLPTAGVATTFKDSGLGSSAPHSLPPVSIHTPDPLPAIIIPQPTVPHAYTFLAPPPSVSGLTHSTICSVSSEPGKRRLLPRVPEHSRYGTGFECTFCGLNQRPTTQGHTWRKHVFADLSPYMCIRTRCSSSGRFYSSKKAWVAHDMACIRSPREGGEAFTTRECPFCAKNFDGNTGRFYSHVAHHMEDIRLFALPPAYREYEEEEYGNGSESGSTDGARSIGGDKSVLGQYLAVNSAVHTVSTSEWALRTQAETDVEPWYHSVEPLAAPTPSGLAGGEHALLDTEEQRRSRLAKSRWLILTGTFKAVMKFLKPLLAEKQRRSRLARHRLLILAGTFKAVMKFLRPLLADEQRRSRLARHRLLILTGTFKAVMKFLRPLLAEKQRRSRLARHRLLILTGTFKAVMKFLRPLLADEQRRRRLARHRLLILTGTFKAVMKFLRPLLADEQRRRRLARHRLLILTGTFKAVMKFLRPLLAVEQRRSRLATSPLFMLAEAQHRGRLARHRLGILTMTIKALLMFRRLSFSARQRLAWSRWLILRGTFKAVRRFRGLVPDPLTVTERKRERDRPDPTRFTSANTMPQRVTRSIPPSQRPETVTAEGGNTSATIMRRLKGLPQAIVKGIGFSPDCFD